MASVTDSEYTFTIGTYYDEDYFPESFESRDSNDSTIRMNGCKIKWENVHYKDIDISFTTYNPITNDFSEKNYYIGKIVLYDSRFQTTKGIHVGSAVEEMLSAYNADNYGNIDTTIYRNSDGEAYYRLTIDGVTLIFYFDESTKIITKIKLGYY